MASPFTPLLDPGKEKYDNPSFMNTPQELAVATAKPTAKANPVIPEELATLEDKLKEEGSSTSTLGHIMAWAGAAKGDFRGLQAIEESKRRTALAKSIVPEIGKVNTLTNAGKWEEASDYVNKLVGSYGARADYLVPYFTAMQANISKKQEGWNQLQALVIKAEESGAADPSHHAHSYYKALARLSKERTLANETTLQGMATRAQPHIQNIEGTVYITDPSSGKTTRDVQQQSYKDKDFDSYTGIKTAAAVGVTTQGLADLFNDRAVKREDGTTIAPNSREASLAKAHYINQQPVEARLKLMKELKIEPALAAQLISQGVSVEDIALGNYGAGGNRMNSALEGQAERLKRQQVALNEATMASDPRALPQGKLPFDLDTFAEVKTPVTPDEIKNSRGRIILLRPEVINDQIKPALAEIENLSLIPGMFENKDPQTVAGRAVSGVAQIASSYLGFPLNEEVKIRQQVKTMLRRAIETVENTPELGKQITGKDSRDLKDLKAYAAGDFSTPLELIKAGDTVTQRLQQVLRRAVAGMESSEVTVTPKEGKPRTAAEVLAPIINKAKGGRPQQSQITQQPYDASGKLTIPGELDPELQQKIQRSKAESLRTGKPTGGAARVAIPTNTPTGQPTLGTPAPQGYNEEDEIKKSKQQKLQQRMR